MIHLIKKYQCFLFIYFHRLKDLEPYAMSNHVMILEKKNLRKFVIFSLPQIQNKARQIM